MDLQWVKCSEGERFCLLRTVVLDRQDREGVYMIWSTNIQRVILIGEGNIKSSLEKHRNDEAVLKYDEPEGRPSCLYATWSFISDENSRKGATSYLTRLYSPAIRAPQVYTGNEVQVNLPQ